MANGILLEVDMLMKMRLTAQMALVRECEEELEIDVNIKILVLLI
jgi:8-oxo-dGTP pyrophosphatase MutT (NUDIX family)